MRKILLCLGALAFFSESAQAQLAVMVIDMQPIFATRYGYDKARKNNQSLTDAVEAQVDVLHLARTYGVPVILIEYEASTAAYPEKFETVQRLSNAAIGISKVTYIRKTTDGAFNPNNSYREELMNYLSREKIDSLIVMGANGGACVQATIEGAIENNIRVTTYADGIADLNYENFIQPYSYVKGSTSWDFCSGRPNCYFRDLQTLDEVYDFMRANTR